MKDYYVYQLRLGTSETPFYIGKGRGLRMKDHLKPSSRCHRSHKNSVINKAMKEGVSVLVEIIHHGLTESDAFEIEIAEIRKYGRRVNGGCLTNATDGGEGVSGWRHTAVTREKLSKTLKSMSAVLSDRQTGSKKTEETRKKMSNAKRLMSDDTRAKIGSASMGRKHTADARKAMSIRKTGRPVTELHAKELKFSRWDANPAWLIADEIYEKWVNARKPGKVRLQKMIDPIRVASMHSKFADGWVPRDDPDWVEYINRRSST